MSISSKIQSLITAANSVTGESRTDLTSAVQDLKDGYGGGGEQIVYRPSGTTYITFRAGNKNRTDCVRTGYSGCWGRAKTDYNTDFIFNTSLRQSTCRYIIRFKSTQNQASWSGMLGTKSGDAGVMIMFGDYQNLYVSIGDGGIYLDTIITQNVWYYIGAYNSGSTSHYFLYDDSGNLVEHKSKSNISLRNETNAMNFGGDGQWSEGNEFRGEIDFSQIAFEIDGQIVWGQLNSKTQNMGIFE